MLTSRWTVRSASAALLAGLFALATAPIPGAMADDGFYPVGHPAEGLPDPARPATAYGTDPDSPLNELFRRLFIAERVPKEVGAALPEERKSEGTGDAEFYVKGWYFRKRPGTERDRLTFGGDVRVSPVEELPAESSARLVSLLGSLDEAEQVDALPELRTPAARLMLQWDLLNTWSRFEKSGKASPDVLRALARAIAACGQSPEVLKHLPDGMNELHAQFDGGKAVDRHHPYLPPSFLAGTPTSPWVEVERRSTVLFHGATSFRTARVFLNAGSVEAGRALVEASASAGKATTLPEVKVGTDVALVLSLVGLTRDLVPVATPVVDEVRIRSLAVPPGLDPTKDTSSSDGLNTWVYFRRRPGSEASPDRPSFRFIPDSAQSLFLEYGTAKRTTFAAQCVLCHRTSFSGGQAAAGIRSLNPFAKPRVIEDPEARFRQAERDIVPTLETLRARLGSAPR